MKTIQDCYLYALTPPAVGEETTFWSKIQESLVGGIDLLQVRLKEGSDQQRLNWGRQIARMAKESGVLLIMNDRLDLGQIIEADGLHLGQDDIPLREARRILGAKQIIGVSTHTLAQAYEAEQQGADYLGFGPCYPTSTKTNTYPQIKLKEITELRQRLTIPFFVIGGLCAQNLAPIISAGANRVAISAGLYQASAIQKTIQHIHQLLSQTSGRRQP